MKKTTLVMITATLVVIIMGYVELQLHASMDRACEPYFSFECEAYALLLCATQGGEYWEGDTYGGVCYGYDCHGLVGFFCIDENFGFMYETVECIDYGCMDCYPNN